MIFWTWSLFGGHVDSQGGFQVFSGGWNCPLNVRIDRQTRIHFQRNSLWLTGGWLGRDITLNLCYISYAFMVDGCAWLCVVYLSYILCCIFDIPQLMFLKVLYLILISLKSPVRRIFFFPIFDILSLLPYLHVSHSHLTVSKCESCLPKILCMAKAIYCQIIDACHPGSISMRKARNFGSATSWGLVWLVRRNIPKTS